MTQITRLIKSHLVGDSVPDRELQEILKDTFRGRFTVILDNAQNYRGKDTTPVTETLTWSEQKSSYFLPLIGSKIIHSLTLPITYSLWERLLFIARIRRMETPQSACDYAFFTPRGYSTSPTKTKAFGQWRKRSFRSLLNFSPFRVMYICNLQRKTIY